LSLPQGWGTALREQRYLWLFTADGWEPALYTRTGKYYKVLDRHGEQHRFNRADVQAGTCNRARLREHFDFDRELRLMRMRRSEATLLDMVPSEVEVFAVVADDVICFESMPPGALASYDTGRVVETAEGFLVCELWNEDLVELGLRLCCDPPLDRARAFLGLSGCPVIAAA